MVHMIARLIEDHRLKVGLISLELNREAVQRRLDEPRGPETEHGSTSRFVETQGAPSSRSRSRVSETPALIVRASVRSASRTVPVLLHGEFHVR